MTGLPKAELHVHLEGTAPPELVSGWRRATASTSRAAAERPRPLPLRGLPRLPAHVRPGGERDPHRRGLPRHHLRVPGACAAEGAIYVELTASPDHAGASGYSTRSTSAASRRGIDDAGAAHGIEGRILISAVRNFGAERALAVAATPRRRPPRTVVRVLNGRRRGRVSRSTLSPRPYAIAAAAGLGCTVHAGEWARARQRPRAALTLPVTRIDHGVRAIEEPALVERAGRAWDRAQHLPDQQRRPRGLPGVRAAPAAAAARRRSPGHARAPTTRRTSARRSAGEYEVCVERLGFTERRSARRSPRPRSTPPSATRTCEPHCTSGSSFGR